MIEGHKLLSSEEKKRDELSEFEIADVKSTIEQLYDPVSKILNDLRPSIERGQYEIIIGDDASGRIPTLIISSAIKNIYASHGIKSPLVRFVAGSRHIKGADLDAKKSLLFSYAEEIKETLPPEGALSFVESIKRKFSKKEARVLFVTEYVASGESIRPFVEAFKQAGVALDVVTVAIEDPKKRKKVPFPLAAVGQEHFPSIYNRSELSGVNKNPSNLFSHRADILENTGQRKINLAREVSRDVAERAAQEFLALEEITKK